MSVTEQSSKPKESYPERAKRIEGELTDRVARMHFLLRSVPGGHVHELLRREKEQKRIGPLHKSVAELTTITSDFESLFRQIPPNYHLEIQISHGAFGGITDSNFPQARMERVGNELGYFVDCGILIGTATGRTVVVPKAVPPTEDYILPYFVLKQLGTPPLEDKHLNLKDISNVKVERNAGTVRPITVLPHK